MSFEKKALEAFKGAIDDGLIYVSNSGLAFSYQGERQFIELLVAYLDKEERSAFVCEWILDNTDDFETAILHQMIAIAPVNYLAEPMRKTANKLLEFYCNEVHSMLNPGKPESVTTPLDISREQDAAAANRSNT